MIEVSVYSAVRPTERPEKVGQAVERLFPSISIDIRDDQVRGYGGLEALRHLHRRLREQRILDTARTVMARGILGNSIQIRISKIAAFMGSVNFPPEEEPLGSIHLQITGDETLPPEVLMDWLAPRTMNGKPIEEIEIEDRSNG
jgi:predicted RNA binding protein with dsRBD fold (UPF0201 family)